MGPAADYEARIRESFPEAVIDAHTELGMDVLVVDAAHLIGVATLLRDEFGFDMLLDVSAVDWLGSERRAPGDLRYDLNYNLLDVEKEVRLRMKVPLPDDDSPHVASVIDVWSGADWHERETYDFFGIIFDGHPYLRRIFMPDEWIGHPLRKDYPVGGVPVEYKIEPAYVGANVVPTRARPAAGGVPARLRRDRGRLSHWTWSGAPASGVRREADADAPTEEENASEEKPEEKKDS